MKNFLKGIDFCSRVSSQSRRVIDWKENGRFYIREHRENATGRYLRCSVSDVDGKRHKLFFPEGKGLINGWNLLIEKLCALGLQGCLELPKPHRETKAQRGAEFHREGFSHGASFAE